MFYVFKLPRNVEASDVTNIVMSSHIEIPVVLQRSSLNKLTTNS